MVVQLTPVIKRYALERRDGEGFGDFCLRNAGVKRKASFAKRFGRPAEKLPAVEGGGCIDEG